MKTTTSRSRPLSLPARLNGFEDMRLLPHSVSPAAISRIYSGDPDSFAMLAVGDAVMEFVPPGVSAFLRSPQFVEEWAANLIVMEGTHQLSWWSKYLEFGPQDRAVRLAHGNVLAIRERLVEARERVRRNQKKTVPTRAALAAETALIARHHAEAEETRMRVAMGASLGHPPVIAELLNMEHVNFRNYVASDIQGKVRERDLARPEIIDRWGRALEELAEMTLSSLGFADTPGAADLYPVKDTLLLAERATANQDFVIRKMVFLRHLRVRLFEKQTAARELDYQRREVNNTEDPVVVHLRSKYFPEYSRLRKAEILRMPYMEGEERHAAEPDEFAGIRSQLQAAGWSASTYIGAWRAWVNAVHPSRGRVVVTSSFMSRKNWGRLQFFVQGGPDWPWFDLPDEGSFATVIASSNPPDIRQALSRSSPLKSDVRESVIEPIDSHHPLIDT